MPAEGCQVFRIRSIYHTMDLTPLQLKAIALTPKVTAAISILMSGVIVSSIIRDRNRCQKIYHRLVLGLSISDIIGSSSMFLTTWLIPVNSKNVAFNYGNEASCRFNAFTTQLVTLTPLYNTSLSLYFLLVIRYGWKDGKLRRLEPYLHAAPLLFGLGTATATASLGIHGVPELQPVSCWIDSKYSSYQWSFMFGPVNICIWLVFIASVMIYCHVRSIEDRTLQYQQHDQRPVAMRTTTDEETGEENRSNNEISPQRGLSVMSSLRPSVALCRRRSDEVAGQCFWFSGVFFLNWFPVSVSVTLCTVSMHSEVSTVGCRWAWLLKHSPTSTFFLSTLLEQV